LDNDQKLLTKSWKMKNRYVTRAMFIFSIVIKRALQFSTIDQNRISPGETTVDGVNDI